MTKSGLHRYSAPDGEHDDIVSAGILAISGAYESGMAAAGEAVLEEALSGKIKTEDHIAAYASVAASSEDDFFEDDQDEEFEFDMDEA